MPLPVRSTLIAGLLAVSPADAELRARSKAGALFMIEAPMGD